jgi:hypothetical protein
MLEQKLVSFSRNFFEKNFIFLLDAYRIRELIYIESTLPSISWLKSNIIENEIINSDPKDSILIKTTEQEEDSHESISNHQRFSELSKLLDILHMLCSQAKQVLEKEISHEMILKQLLKARNSP